MEGITAQVISDLRQIRDTGQTNMVDVSAVQGIANKEGMHELVLCIEEKVYPRSRRSPDMKAWMEILSQI